MTELDIFKSIKGNIDLSSPNKFLKLGDDKLNSGKIYLQNSEDKELFNIEFNSGNIITTDHNTHFSYLGNAKISLYNKDNYIFLHGDKSYTFGLDRISGDVENYFQESTEDILSNYVFIKNDTKPVLYINPAVSLLDSNNKDTLSNVTELRNNKKITFTEDSENPRIVTYDPENPITKGTIISGNIIDETELDLDKISDIKLHNEDTDKEFSFRMDGTNLRWDNSGDYIDTKTNVLYTSRLNELNELNSSQLGLISKNNKVYFIETGDESNSFKIKKNNDRFEICIHGIVEMKEV